MCRVADDNLYRTETDGSNRVELAVGTFPGVDFDNPGCGYRFRHIYHQ